MELRVLGPLRIIGDDGRDVYLASVEKRRMVSMFAQHAGSAVLGDFLCEQLGLTHGGLRTSISRLRERLGPDVIATQPPGYSLTATNIDAVRFQSILRLVRSADTSSKVNLLRRAVDLWRGDAYAEFAQEHWIIAEARRLEELRAGAVERLVDLLCASGNFDEAIAQLLSQISKHPFREGSRSLMMHALAESGRRVDALRAYQEYRAFLADETGTEPSHSIIELERLIALSR